MPEFANLRVVKMDPEGRPILTPISRPPTMRELMTHTAGFAYGIADDPSSPADQAYYQAGVLQSASLEDMAAKGQASGDAAKQAAATTLSAKIDEVLNSNNHRWFIDKMDPSVKEERQKRMDEFKKRYE